jgi:opacity protein-like surface antigen
MKKLQTILVLGLCVTALPSIVNAAQGEYYLRADLGYLKGKIINTDKSGIVKAGNTDLSKVGKGVSASAGIGYYLSDAFRAEAQLYYDTGVKAKNTLITSSKQKTMGVLINGYFDLMPSSVFVPYVMAGVGYGKNKYELLHTAVPVANGQTLKSKSKNEMMYQVGAGLGFKVMPQVMVDLGYRFLSKGSKAVDCVNGKGDIETCKLKTVNMFTGGVRVAF